MNERKSTHVLVRVFNQVTQFHLTFFSSLKGFMHAGYPIMMHTSSAPDLLKLTNKEDPWGPIHELGHNQQIYPKWEFHTHTGETTNNLWSVFICETVYKLEWPKAHPELTQSNRFQRTEKYVKGGRNLEDWTVWTALETYLQVMSVCVYVRVCLCAFLGGYICSLLTERSHLLIISSFVSRYDCKQL